VYAKDLVVDHHGQSEEVEHIREVMPHICVAVFPCAFGVEAIGLCYATGLVVSSDQVNARRVAKFEADEEGDGLDREETTVNVIACAMVLVSGRLHPLSRGEGWVCLPRNK